MASCTDIPTLTTTILQTTSTPSTTLTTLTTTLPPTESFVTTTECILTQNSTCAGSTILTSTTTIPGLTSTLTSTISTDVPVTSSQVSTLFSRSCTTPTTPPPPTSESSTTSIMTSQTTSTLPNGDTTVMTTTVTSIMAGNTTVTSPNMQNSDTAGGGGRSSTPSNLGAIIGGAVGGFFGLVALVLLVWFIIKRRRRWDDIFDHDEALGSSGHDRRFSLSADLDGDPKPYQYGLVGLPGSSPAPSNSPPLRPTQLGSESSYGGSTAYGGMVTDPHQLYNRGGSFSPLNLPPGAVATGMQHTPSTMSVSRPSTAGSTQPLTNNGRPISQHGMPPPPQQGVYQQPQNSYPPAMQQYNQQHQRGQSSMTAHSATPSLNSPPLQPMTGWMMNTGVPNNPQPGEELGRSGSPMSYQEPRRLQIANYRDSVASSSPIDEESPRRPSISQGGITPFTASGEPSQRDGKGRLRTSGSGNVLVHTDGGRVQQSSSQPGQSSGNGAEPAPPAYTLD